MHLCSKRPESTLTASRAVAAVHVHSEESRKPSPSGFPNLNNSLVPPPCHSVGTRMLTSLTSEQRHCTIQFTLYIKSAKKKKKKRGKMNKNLGVEELRGRQYLYSWGPKLIWQVAWLRNWIYSQCSRVRVEYQPDWGPIPILSQHSEGTGMETWDSQLLRETSSSSMSSFPLLSHDSRILSPTSRIPRYLQSGNCHSSGTPVRRKMNTC